MSINFIHSFLSVEPSEPEVPPLVELDFLHGIYKVDGVEVPLDTLLGDSPDVPQAGGTFNPAAIDEEGMLLSYGGAVPDDPDTVSPDTLTEAFTNRPYLIGPAYDAFAVGCLAGCTIVFDLNYPTFAPYGPPMMFLDDVSNDDCFDWVGIWDGGVDDGYDLDLFDDPMLSMGRHRVAVTLNRDVGGTNSQYAWSLDGRVAITQTVPYDDPFPTTDLSYITLGHSGDDGYVMDIAYIRSVTLWPPLAPEELPGLSVIGATALGVYYTGRFDGMVGFFEGFDLQGIYGNPPYSYAIVSGTLPAGLSFNATTGLVSGTPTTLETQTVVFRVTDDSGDTADTDPILFGIREVYISVTDVASAFDGTVTMTGIEFGPEADDRIIAVATTCGGGAPTAIAIDGVTARLGVRTTTGLGASIFYTALPTGTVGSLTVTGAGSLHQSTIARIVGVSALGVRDSDLTGNSSSLDNSLTVTADSNALVFAAAVNQIDDSPYLPGPIDWTGIYELNEQTINGRQTQSTAQFMTALAGNVSFTSTNGELGTTAMVAVSFKHLPPDPIAYLDFVNGQYYAGGATRAVGAVLGGGFNPASIDETGMAVIAAASNTPDAIGPLLSDITTLMTGSGMTVRVELALIDALPAGPLVTVMDTSSASTAVELIEAKIASSAGTRSLNITDNDGLTVNQDVTLDFTGGTVQVVAFTFYHPVGSGLYETAGDVNAGIVVTGTGIATQGAVNTVHLFHVNELSELATAFKVRSIKFYTALDSADLSALSDPPVPSDIYWSFTVLLMGFNGADGAVAGDPGSFDESLFANPNSFQGNAQLDTAQKKFGVSSLLLDGSGDYIINAGASVWLYGTNPFTIEGWFRFSAHDGTVALLGEWFTTLSARSWIFHFDSGNLLFRGVDTGGTQRDGNTYALAPTLNTWYHLACDRDSGGNLRVYVNGAMVSKTTGYTHNLRDTGAQMMIGRSDGTASYDLAGWVDEVRVTNGIARYASDAGYVVPWGPFPRTDNSARVTQSYVEVIRSADPIGGATGTATVTAVGICTANSVGAATGKTSPLQPLGRGTAVKRAVGSALGGALSVNAVGTP